MVKYCSLTAEKRSIAGHHKKGMFCMLGQTWDADLLVTSMGSSSVGCTRYTSSV